MTGPDIAVAITCAVNLVGIGISWGSLSTKVTSLSQSVHDLRRKLDNGLSAKIEDVHSSVVALEATCKARRESKEC